MVNVSHSATKQQLLDMLQSNSEPISGNDLGRRLGISRVAVHKHITALRNHGYDVESTRKGYYLVHDSSQPLSPWTFKPEEMVTVLENVGSTMDESRKRDELSQGEDFTLAALRQSAGRGRRGRPWESPEGGLWITRVLHPDSSAFHMQKYTLAAAAAVVRVLKENWDIEAKAKWPNDALVDGRKIAGVLAEARISGDRIQSLSLGLGLNANNRVPEGAVSLQTLLKREVDRRVVLEAWIAALDRILCSKLFSGATSEHSKNSLPWFSELMDGLGEHRRFRLSGHIVEGLVRGVDSWGRLILEVSSGEKLHLSPGDVEKA